ncbi:uncharacterized protein CCOS01_06531 [Colletotrichum costaricense]|uniref:Uncharacterized protein n=1 Tax=Colletotrichum costaricense TaxID=1209916 RepID=A0AAI9YZQ8_9PEZI|nr:uncharacterized protein CCOS01_06531 [Colletotrichum costaricense]KAK1528697.1 hypothetical protein CCOS01_06531 [Colletotrichum costaricense]
MQHKKQNCGQTVSTQSQPKLDTDTDNRPLSQTASFKGPSFNISSFVSAIANPPTITRDVAGIEQDSQRILELWTGQAAGHSMSTTRNGC